MQLFKPRTDILPPAQQTLWPLLNQLGHGFVLYGGTAVALHYGHRESVDFDFFSSTTFDPDKLKSAYSFLDKGTVLNTEENTLSLLAPTSQGEVKLSFFGGLKFGRASSPVICEDTHLRVASPLDLAVQKLKVIRVRSESKDYFDLDCLLQNGVNLSEALGAAEQLYPNFPVAVTLRAMCYFAEGDVAILPDSVKKRLTQEVRTFSAPVPWEKDSDQLDLSAAELGTLKTIQNQVCNQSQRHDDTALGERGLG
jgi:hypothetical protein